MTSTRTLLAAALSAAALSACVVAPARPYAYAEPGVTVDVAPPAPYVEAVPVEIGRASCRERV